MLSPTLKTVLRHLGQRVAPDRAACESDEALLKRFFRHRESENTRDVSRRGHVMFMHTQVIRGLMSSCLERF